MIHFLVEKGLEVFTIEKKSDTINKSIKGGGGGGGGVAREARAISKTFSLMLFITSCQNIRLKVSVPLNTVGELRDATPYH